MPRRATRAKRAWTRAEVGSPRPPRLARSLYVNVRSPAILRYECTHVALVFWLQFRPEMPRKPRKNGPVGPATRRPGRSPPALRLVARSSFHSPRSDETLRPAPVRASRPWPLSLQSGNPPVRAFFGNGVPRDFTFPRPPLMMGRLRVPPPSLLAALGTLGRTIRESSHRLRPDNGR